MNTVDVKIENEGTISLVTPLNAAAREWIDENIHTESWQWIGGSVAVEPRCLENLIEGMQEAGLQVN